MLGQLFRALLLGLVVSSLFKNRYRIMNWVLGNRTIRQIVVSGMMTVPAIKQLFSNSLFSTRENSL